MSFHELMRRATVATLACSVAFAAASVAGAQASGTVAGEVTAGSASTSAATDARLDELERQIAALQATVAKLVSAQQTAASTGRDAVAVDLPELTRRVDLLAQEVETAKLGDDVPAPAPVLDAAQREPGFGLAASKVYQQSHGLSIGGYGELLYQNHASRLDSGAPAVTGDELTLERAVLFVGYKLTDQWLFNSELEWEEGGQESSVELAYLDYLWRRHLGVRFGHLLMPVGLVNELHEPTAYLGAMRPLVEQVIIPSTWHQSGAGLFGDAGPLTWRTYVVTGFDARRFSADGLREARQEGQVKGADFAWTGRLDWSVAPGLLVGGAAYAGDSGQGMVDVSGRRIAAPTRLFEAHGEWRWRGLETRALWARATIGDAARIDQALGLTGAASIGSELRGWYAQAGYDVLAGRGDGRMQLAPYARWESLDTQRAVPHGFLRDLASERHVLTLGLEWKPIEQTVIKLDWQNDSNAARTGLDQWNLGVGYVF